MHRTCCLRATAEPDNDDSFKPHFIHCCGWDMSHLSLIDVTVHQSHRLTSRTRYGAVWIHPVPTLCSLAWYKRTSRRGRVVVVHAFNPSTQEAEAAESLRVRGQPGLQKLVPGHLGLLHREPLSRKTKKMHCRQTLL